MSAPGGRSSRPVALLLGAVLALAACTSDTAQDPGESAPATTDEGADGPAPDDGVPEGEQLPGAQPTPELPESGLVDPPVEGFADAERIELDVPDEAFVRRLSPDGTNLLASAPDDDGLGCEEGAPSSLQLRAAEGGTFTPVLPPGTPDGQLVDAGLGRVLIVAGCEGFVYDAVLAEELDDGALRILEELVLPDGGEEASITALAPLVGGDGGAEGAPDGVIAARVGPDGPELVEAGLDGTERDAPTPLPTEAYRLWPTTFGLFVTQFDEDASAEALVDVRSPLRLVGFDDADVSDDGTILAAAGDAGVTVLGDDGSVVSWVEDPIGDDVQWGAPVVVAPDRVLVLRDRFGESELVVVGPEGVLAEIDAGVADLPRPSLSSDGTRLLYATVDPDSFATTHVVRVQR